MKKYTEVEVYPYVVWLIEHNMRWVLYLQTLASIPLFVWWGLQESYGYFLDNWRVVRGMRLKK